MYILRWKYKIELLIGGKTRYHKSQVYIRSRLIIILLTKIATEGVSLPIHVDVKHVKCSPRLEFNVTVCEGQH